MSTQPTSNPIDDPNAGESPLGYRSINSLATLGLIVAAFSFLTIFHWLYWFIPIAAASLAYLGIRQIRFAPTEYTGLGIARTGMTVAVSLGLIGHIAGHYIQKYTIPYGYKPITWEILQPDPHNPSEIIPDAARDLEPSDKDRDRRVFISGYINLNMTNRTMNLKQFILVPTASHCNFCQAQIKSTEMILINFVDGTSLNATQNEIKIGGKFQIDSDQEANPFGGLPYRIDADCLQE
jgi:hypothetical protein